MSCNHPKFLGESIGGKRERESELGGGEENNPSGFVPNVLVCCSSAITIMLYHSEEIMRGGVDKR